MDHLRLELFDIVVKISSCCNAFDFVRQLITQEILLWLWLYECDKNNQLKDIGGELSFYLS